MQAVKYVGFGNLTKAYSLGRTPYAQEALDVVVANTDQGPVLDLGCGTGISSRQLAQYFKVVAFDSDVKMLEEAQKHPHKNILYRLGTVGKLPIPHESFPSATAFCSFHWFSALEEVEDIKRVLVPEAKFVVVSKRDVSPVRADYETVLREILQDSERQLRREYDPTECLREGGFSSVTEHKLNIESEIPRAQLLQQMQSYHAWNQISEENRPSTLESLASMLDTKYPGKKVPQTHDYVIAIAAK